MKSMRRIHLTIFIVSIAFAGLVTGKVEDSKKSSTPTATTKREYTEEEFKVAVMEEAAKLMKKAGSANLVDFSKELLEKEDLIKNKELNLKKEQEELEMSKGDFKKKLVEFQDSQKKFIGCVDEKNEKANKRVSQMVDVISGMKPQSAADVLTVQDPDLSVRILGELDSAKASKIFNLMDKEVSARLQKQFLQMKK